MTVRGRDSTNLSVDAQIIALALKGHLILVQQRGCSDRSIETAGPQLPRQRERRQGEAADGFRRMRASCSARSSMAVLSRATRNGQWMPQTSDAVRLVHVKQRCYNDCPHRDTRTAGTEAPRRCMSAGDCATREFTYGSCLCT